MHFRAFSASLSVSKQSCGAPALNYHQSLSYSTGIYDVPLAACLAGDRYGSPINTEYWTQRRILNRSPLHVICGYEGKKSNSQLMCQLSCSTRITSGIVSLLAATVLEKFTDGDGTSRFPPGTAPVKTSVQNPKNWYLNDIRRTRVGTVWGTRWHPIFTSAVHVHCRYFYFFALEVSKSMQIILWERLWYLSILSKVCSSKLAFPPISPKSFGLWLQHSYIYYQVP